MSEVPSITGERAVSAFGKFGFSVVRISGSRHIMKKPGYRYNLSVPVHKGKIVKKGTLRRSHRGRRITVEQFVAAIG